MKAQVLLSDRAKTFLRAVPPEARRRLKQSLTILGEDPTGKAGKLNTRALDVPRSATPVFRLAVGPFRVAFCKERHVVRVLRIFHRSEGYGWLEDA